MDFTGYADFVKLTTVKSKKCLEESEKRSDHV